MFQTKKMLFFVKCINFITGKDYKLQFLYFIRNEKGRSNILTKVRNQPFYRENNIILGYYAWIGVFPRSVTDRNNALFLYNIIFCLMWISERASFNQAIEELKNNFKIIDNFITGENV